VTIETSAEERVESPSMRWARIVLALVLLSAGLWAVGLIAWWYGADNVFVGGAHLKDPSAVRLPAFVAALVLVGGFTSLLMRRHFRGAAGLLGLGVLVVVGVIAADLAVTAYPRVVDARVLSIDPDTRYIDWSVAVPLYLVSGVVSATDTTITVDGTAMDHGCRDSHRGVTLDRATGRVIEVVDLPGSYPGATSPVGGAEPLSAYGLVSEAGEIPTICLN
jgi:hypothetical protein